MAKPEAKPEMSLPELIAAVIALTARVATLEAVKPASGEHTHPHTHEPQSAKLSQHTHQPPDTV